MSLDVKVNSGRAQRFFKSLAADTRKKLEGGTASIGLVAEGFTKKSIQTNSGGGETYEKYEPRRQHTASAPGDAPNSDTGDLASSIFLKVDRANLSATIGSRLEQAPALEFGTKNMAARPFLRPAANYVRPKYVKAVSDILKEAGKLAKRKAK
ncbi:MAG: hypothetical protein JKY34_12725 [Kordiimonadaceae bacterium]|nr:hypothetical protein [Kordiimonadaceae bacterium]